MIQRHFGRCIQRERCRYGSRGHLTAMLGLVCRNFKRIIASLGKICGLAQHNRCDLNELRLLAHRYTTTLQYPPDGVSCGRGRCKRHRLVSRSRTALACYCIDGYNRHRINCERCINRIAHTVIGVGYNPKRVCLFCTTNAQHVDIQVNLSIYILPRTSYRQCGRQAGLAHDVVPECLGIRGLEFQPCAHLIVALVVN